MRVVPTKSFWEWRYHTSGGHITTHLAAVGTGEKSMGLLGDHSTVGTIPTPTPSWYHLQYPNKTFPLEPLGYPGRVSWLLL